MGAVSSLRTLASCQTGWQGSLKNTLPTDAWWVIREVIAGATIRVVRISGLRCLYARTDLWIGTILAVGQVSTVVGTTSLPSDPAWPTSQRTVAAIAVVVM